jgi:hypothetical protein
MNLRLRLLLLTITSTLVGASLFSTLSQPQAEAAPEAKPGSEEPDAPDLTLEEPVALDNMHHLMEYVFEPAYKRLKEDLASEPADKAAWKDIKGDTLTLAEASNLLFHRAPEDDVAAWIELSVATRKAGNDVYQAARQRDFSAARTSYEGMLKSCNACHDKFADGDYQLKP